MTDDALQLLQDSPEAALLLAAYARSQSVMTQEPAAEDDAAGWSQRLSDVPGVDDAHLAPLHGKLIALGLLKFQLAGRVAGVVYRVSPAGEAALNQLRTVDAAGSPEARWDAAA